METDVLGWVVLTVCLALSFLLSGMEAGVFALNRLRVRQMARAGRPSAKLLHGFLENPERFMWTILVGNTLANFFILGWMVTKLYEWLPGHGVWLVAVFMVVVFLFYALFDLLPKMLFRVHPNQFCLWAANVFQLVHFTLRPLGRVGRANLRHGVALDGRAGVYRPALWQPGGNARVHAGIRPSSYKR